MARPIKRGMEYFPHDTDARNDMKIRKLRAVHGNDGYATYFILLENIYRSNDYKMEVSDTETRLILSEECRISEQKLSEIILKCLDLDLFSKMYYEKYELLTSEAILLRAAPIEKKRKKNKSDYEDRKEAIETVENDEIIVSDTETRLKVHKEEKSRVEESKEEKKEKENILLQGMEQIWSEYPLKEGKSSAFKKLPKIIQEEGKEQILRCISRYKESIKAIKKSGFKERNYQMGSTFFNGTYVDYLDINVKVNEKSRDRHIVIEEGGQLE